MISQKVKYYLENKGWWFDEASEDYKNALGSIGIDEGADISNFYCHAEGGPTFYSRNREIYQLGWFILNSDYNLAIERTHNSLKLPSNYIPLDSFEGESGFFYNKGNGAVIHLSLGEGLQKIQAGDFNPQWKDFNSFIEWYFEL